MALIPVLLATCLRARYAVSGTGIAQSATCLRAAYARAMSGTDVSYSARFRFLARLVVCGRDVLGCGAIRQRRGRGGGGPRRRGGRQRIRRERRAGRRSGRSGGREREWTSSASTRVNGCWSLCR
eukprot:2102442-Rhodomonas_salina.1